MLASCFQGAFKRELSYQQNKQIEEGIVSIAAFIEKFAFAIEVDAAELNAGTKFKELPTWDSINALSVIAMADEEYGVTLSGDDIQNSETLADIQALVESKKA